MKYAFKNLNILITLNLAIAFIFGGIAMATTGMDKIEGSVWYRERIMPPPSAVVRVILEGFPGPKNMTRPHRQNPTQI